MAQDLDPNSEGRGVLQFKTGLMSVIKVTSFITCSVVVWIHLKWRIGYFPHSIQRLPLNFCVLLNMISFMDHYLNYGNFWLLQQKLAKRDGSQIDRSHDIERLWEFYQRYKQRHRVDDIRREEEKWRESGVFSTNVGE